VSDDNDIDMSLFFTVRQKDKSAVAIEIVKASQLMSTACNVVAQVFAYPMLAVV
jgi:hypothetical protein